MDPNEFRLFMAGDAPAQSGFPNIGDSYQGGYYAGSISHTANGVATHALIVAPRASGASGTGYPLTTMYRWANATGYYGTSSHKTYVPSTLIMVLISAMLSWGLLSVV